MKVLAKECAYTNADEMVRDKIVFGTKHAKVREKLINEGSDLTLEKAIDIARTYEIEQKHLKTMNTGEDPNISVIHKSQPYKPRSTQSTPKNKQNSSDRQNSM